MAPPIKGLKLTKALRTAARLPARVSGGKGSGRNRFTPIPGEAPVVILRLQVIGCKDLVGKDKNGSCDPYVVISFLNTRFQTPVSKKNTSPTYTPKDATFDFPIYLSLAEKLGAVELVVWDKDMLMKKEYLGEAAVLIDEYFSGGKSLGFDDPDNKSTDVQLVSSREGSIVTGSVQIKLGFVLPPNAAPVNFSEVLADIVKRSRPSLVSAPPTEGIGTIRSHESGPHFEDDGGISSDDEGDTDDEDEGPGTLTPGASASEPETKLQPSTTVKSSPKPPSSGLFPKIFPKRNNTGSSTTPTLSVPESGTLTPSSTPTTKKKKFRKSSSPKNGDYNFNAGSDIMGIVMLEVQGATDLPRFSNITRTGWDMDPFVVISFGKKVFRTRVIRHSRNPVWDEKLLFHVRQYESAFKVQLVVHDWDKLSSNDHIGDVTFNVSELLADAPQPDPSTGLYAADEGGDHPMKEFKLPLSMAKETPWDGKTNAIITFRAKYQPYDALRQRFWRQYLTQYDTDDTGCLSHLELTSMLDSLGSTLSSNTINSFFTRNGKKPKEDELTMAEAIQCLETELNRPDSERRRLDAPDDSSPGGTSLSPTPLPLGDEPKDGMALGQLNFSGMPMATVEPDVIKQDPTSKPKPPTNQPTPAVQQPLVEVITPNSPAERQESSSDDDLSPGLDDSFERVINIKNCPLCHRPRLNSKAEMDIVTHMAVCASSDWAKIDRIVVGNYVTASQAQRKWYTRVISKVSGGDYRLGANSANIIVQNRMTGQLEEEKMQVYVRLGIRLLYKGAKGRMEGGRARRLLKSLSLKQGIKYDDPESAAEIPLFIEFHNLDVNEILDPLDSFKNFNEFFYRKLKPTARPVEAPDDPYRLVSGADCRLMTFETVNEATRLWIKGREFTVSRLLGSVYKGQADRYIGGALAIFRLAPQDYHRFHSPVDGTIGPMTYIPGEYYTVNPQAIRTSLDVYGENVRKIVPIDSPHFGRVMAVCVGAMMVGSIQTTVQEGDHINRGQEFGYFAFGGSTIVLLFEKSVTVEWDEDLLINGRASLETLVRVGMGIGRGRRAAS